MSGVLIGFTVLGAVILVGYIVGRTGVLGEHGQFVLGRAAFFVLSPFLLFTVLADADVSVVFSLLLPVSLIAAAVSGLTFALIARLAWHRGVSETVVGALASGYVNSNYIGVPVAIYVLGNPAYAAPIVLLQLLLFAPIALTILAIQRRGSVSVGTVLTEPLRNPILIASLAGVVLSVAHVKLPDAVMEPFRVIGAAAVPVVLIAFGMSLHGQRVLAAGSARRDVILASALKLVLMPVVAWVIGHFVFQFTGAPLFAVVVLAALPTAQNVFIYAQRYERGEIVARDVVLITTVLCVPVLVVIAALLAPA
jgi:predicted permease